MPTGPYTNLFGPQNNRSLVGKLTDHIAHSGNWNIVSAARNAKRRQLNAQSAGLNPIGQLGAFFTPNRTERGNELFHGVVSAANNIPYGPERPEDTANLDDDSGGGSGGGYRPDMVEYPPDSGFFYDLNNPAQRVQFFKRRLEDLNLERDRGFSGVDTDIADTETAAADWVSNYFRDINEMGEGKTLGDVNRANFFAQLSPNAFQSSQATSGEFANQKYLESLADAATQAQRTVGSEFLDDPTDFDRLGADSDFGRARANLFIDRDAIGRQYNDFLSGINQQTNPATDPFRFERERKGMPQPGAVNLSGATPFTNFQAPSQVMQPRQRMTVGNMFGGSGGQNLDSFLGRNAPQQRDIDYLRNYLLGR